MRIVRFTFWVCIVAGLIFSSIITLLRIRGLIPAEQYSWAMIVCWPIALVVVVPGIFWLVQQPRMQPWIERLGTVMLFGVIPAIIILAIVQWFIVRPT